MSGMIKVHWYFQNAFQFYRVIQAVQLMLQQFCLHFRYKVTLETWGLLMVSPTGCSTQPRPGAPLPGPSSCLVTNRSSQGTAGHKAGYLRFTSVSSSVKEAVFSWTNSPSSTVVRLYEGAYIPLETGQRVWVATEENVGISVAVAAAWARIIKMC